MNKKSISSVSNIFVIKTIYAIKTVGIKESYILKKEKHNEMAKENKTKIYVMVHKTAHIKLKSEQHKPHYKPVKNPTVPEN